MRSSGSASAIAGGLDDHDPVELQALGDARRHQLDLSVLVVAVLGVEPAVRHAGGGEGGAHGGDPGIRGDDADRAGAAERRAHGVA